MSVIEKHRLHGRIVTDVARPESDLVQRLGRHATATLVDAMGGYGFMHYEIKPLVPETLIVGPALTILTKPGDVLYVKKALDLVQPGDVVVIDSGGLKDFAVFGDRFAENFAHKGAVGVVIDGAVRDSQGIIDAGFPAFCRGSCIPYHGSVGPGAINVPISCGGVTVNPGDVVVGNRDGIVVIPREAAEDVARLADAHLAGEHERVRQRDAGVSAEEIYKLAPLLKRWETP
ncbi:RraA family protein [Bosea massiliensis]|uniref:Putative 4-hydroxy-4-methyl-2-oxoglutarate aldolase n=1 Tax=Bosea massiliensis TaxID=151419 RepID=A0ABW0P9X5_9HYPH